MNNKMLLLILCLLPSVATAEIYKYTDENGITRYSDKPPVNKNATTIDVKKPVPAPAKTPEQIELEKQAEALAKERAIFKEHNDKAIADREEREHQAKIRAQEEANSKFSGCKLADQLKFLRQGGTAPDRLLKSANDIKHEVHGSGIHSKSVKVYVYNPVCGNQTRYRVATNYDNFVLSKESIIER